MFYSLEAMSILHKTEDLKITLISHHGLLRADQPQLGKDVDTGGQIRYVLELAKDLAKLPQVTSVELLTRQIIDPKVDSSYAQLEEPISDKAKIVRIPFGPKRYLRKEALWPYIEMFVDQTLVHFRKHGIPDIIHGHYADAGFAGAQLARLLHVPFVFTGHSLGRVKKQRLALGKVSLESIEKKYRIAARIEAEEFALESASMVVTSTNQEVHQQYELYDHYAPERMEVIPPGVDLSCFNPIGDSDLNGDKAPATTMPFLSPFLRNPNKPIILAMARPDERKNLQALVRVYGKSQRLQELANLVLILGTRQDLADLPTAQQEIIKDVFALIDHYDLYGKVAYPKTHSPNDVPDLYRLAAMSKGVFVNPALTEPFGLTLLEAGACGLPIIATNDGGPRDIIMNCQNGLLVDPLDDEAIDHALLRVLTDDKQWEIWSSNGISGTREHYSWQTHAHRYLRDLKDILAESQPPVLQSVKLRSRRITEFDRIIITDLDNTLTGDNQALEEFKAILADNAQIGFGIATGRSLPSALKLIEELGLQKPDLIDSGAGTELHYGINLTPDASWQKQIGYDWKPEQVRKVIADLDGIYLQEEENQSTYKISYDVDLSVAPSLSEIKQQLRAAGLRCKTIFSNNMYLDIVPVRGGTDLSIRHLLWKWGFGHDHVLVAGDSGNDLGMLLGKTLGVVVGNYSPELERLRKRPRIYFADGHHARGIIEGINYYQFLGDIVIPNARLEENERAR